MNAVSVLALACILTQISIAVAADENSTPAHPKHVKPSQIRGKPLPRPSAKPPRAHGIKTEAPNASPVALQPKPPTQGARPPTAFVLSKSGPGKLLLKYETRNPKLEFDQKAPFIIQLNAGEPLKLEPSVITRENWPKGATQMTLSYQGASPQAENVILGKAAYIVCEQRTKECRQAKVPIELHFR